MPSFFPQTPGDAVLATLSFFRIFDHPLTLPELERFLLRFEMGQEEIRKWCKEIPAIEEHDGFYCLKGQKHIIEKRIQQREVYEKRMKKARSFLPLLMMIPFVRGVFVCNNLSFGIATPGGDIDLFIVTEKDHIFLARFLVTGLLHVLGVRRHGTKIEGRFCLSFYAAKDALNFADIVLKPQDIYMAFWMKSLIVIGDQRLYFDILGQNRSWLGKYFSERSIGNEGVFPAGGIKMRKFYAIIRRIGEMFWNSFPGKKFEKMLSERQQKGLSQSYSSLEDTSGTIISEKMLKFHDRDKRSFFQTKWIETLSGLKILK